MERTVRRFACHIRPKQLSSENNRRRRGTISPKRLSFNILLTYDYSFFDVYDFRLRRVQRKRPCAYPATWLLLFFFLLGNMATRLLPAVGLVVIGALQICRWVWWRWCSKSFPVLMSYRITQATEYLDDNCPITELQGGLHASGESVAQHALQTTEEERTLGTGADKAYRSRYY